jgi:CRP-like cAMP-binding protein
MRLEDQWPGVQSTAQRVLLQELTTQSLAGCSPETIAAVLATARVRTVQPGDTIYAQGEPVPLTLILRGYGFARRTTASGQEIVSGVAPAGILFGWSGIKGAPSSVQLVALTVCEVAQWPGHEIRSLVAGDPALGLVAIDSMAGSLHETVERIDGFLHQDARRRVLRILGRHRDLFFSEPPILTRAHLPGLVGTSREMTGRVLRQLESERTVKRFGRTGLRLLRPDQLEAGTAQSD